MTPDPSPWQPDPDTLSAALDRLLPAHEELSGAGAMGLAVHVSSEAARYPALGVALRAALDALPAGFAGLDGAAQDEALRAVEAADPLAFAGLLNLAYNAYYTQEPVLRLIERRTGYAARPPQPLGYELAPFDESVLAVVRQREPFWRKA